MLDVLSVTGVVFVIIGAGYLAVRFGLLGEAELKALTKYLMGLALPALLLNALGSRHFGEVFDIAYAGAFLFGSLAAFGIIYAVSRFVFGSRGSQTTFDAMGSSAANSGFITYPMLTLIMPAVAPLALAMNMMVENLVMLPLILTLAESSRRGGASGFALAGQILKRVLLNPIMVGLFAGLTISLANIDLPLIIQKPIELLAFSAAAPSLVIIGGNLALLPSGSLNGRLVAVTTGKLVLHPLATLTGLVLMAGFGFQTGNPDLYNAAIIAGAVPQMGLYVMLATGYGEGKHAAFTMFVTTVTSFFTLSALLWYLGAVPQ